MKKAIILLVIVFSFNLSYAQWQKGGKKDPFDGDYKYTIVKGYGGDYPYSKPSFVINRYGDRQPSLYITDMGSLACDQPYVKIVVDSNPDKIYSFSLNKSNDGDSGFLQYSTTNITLLLEDFKNGSKATLRFTTGCSENTFVIGLSGSTSGINYVIGDYFNNKLEEGIKLTLEKSEQDKKDKATQIIKEDARIKKEEEDEELFQKKYTKWKTSITDSINSFYNNYNLSVPKEELTIGIFNNIVSPYFFGGEEEKLVSYYKRTKKKLSFVNKITILYSKNLKKYYINRIEDSYISPMYSINVKIKN